MKILISLSAAGLLAAGFLNAQEVPRFTFSIGGGFVEPVGGTGTQLDMGGMSAAAQV